jgi:hypothetical protein
MAQTYEITIEEHLDLRWQEWLGGMQFTHLAGGETRLRGELPDQTALYGLLERMRDLNLTLVALVLVSTPHS